MDARPKIRRRNWDPGPPTTFTDYHNEGTYLAPKHISLPDSSSPFNADEHQISLNHARDAIDGNEKMVTYPSVSPDGKRTILRERPNPNYNKELPSGFDAASKARAQRREAQQARMGEEQAKQWAELKAKAAPWMYGGAALGLGGIGLGAYYLWQKRKNKRK